MSGGIEVLGRIGPEGPGVLVLYTGGTIGMGHGADGSLEPLDLRDHLPFIQRLPISLTIATFVNPPVSWCCTAPARWRTPPGLRGLVLEAYGAGNGPTESWFLDPLREAVERGVTVVVTTQCRAGSAVPGGDMTT